MKYIFLIATIFFVSACSEVPLAQPEPTASTEQTKLIPTTTSEVIKPVSPLPTPVSDKPTPIPEIINYTFGTPELILETTTPIKLAQWIPDSNEELLVQSATTDKYTIETLNIRTGERKRLVETDNLLASPVWLWATQEIAYVNQDKESETRLNFSKADQKDVAREIASQIYPVVSPGLACISQFKN